MTLPDIQSTKPLIKRPIQQVGVENVELPFQVESKYGGFMGNRYLTAMVSMRTDLDSNIKGISMSRFLRTLKTYLNTPLKRFLIKSILQDFQDKVGGHSSYIKFNFKLPIYKKSPSTQHSFPLYYSCKFEGQLHTSPQKDSSHFRFFQGVTIQYASYCPCSAELCNDLKQCDQSGFPHAQRSFAHILVENLAPASKYSPYVWLEDIIEAVENRIKTLPYPIIKREDEREIAKIASENPLFVEDAVRLISEALDELPVYDWIVKCVHQESIHTSEAIAINSKGIQNGLNAERFI